jgi:hypothetical protein
MKLYKLHYLIVGEVVLLMYMLHSGLEERNNKLDPLKHTSGKLQAHTLVSASSVGEEDGCGLDLPGRRH